MKKQVASLPVPKPHAIACPACGHDAVQVHFYSPRIPGLTDVTICSVCNPSFYPKAERLLREVAA